MDNDEIERRVRAFLERKLASGKPFLLKMRFGSLYVTVSKMDGDAWRADAACDGHCSGTFVFGISQCQWVEDDDLWLI